MNVNIQSERMHIQLTWTSTGSCPPSPHDKTCEWIKSPSFVQNLAWISALPNNGIEFIRVHWLLSAISISRSNDSIISYNFSCLDQFLEKLHHFNMSPIFEVMGNPSNYFTDFEDKTEVMIWNDLIYTMTTRYIDKFGLEYLKRWLFETWNEPKQSHFDSIKVSPKGLLNYYDATYDGVKRGHHRLKLVTTGGGCSRKFDLGNYCWLLLHHIHNNESIFGGWVFPDLISIHEKGVYPESSSVILEGETNFIRTLNERLPRFQNTAIINDEADPQVSWNISRDWQAHTSYAAIMVKTIHDHLLSKDVSVRSRIKLLSNDNAYLSFHPFPFTQRTLLARFQVNVTSPPHVQFVRKPSYSVLGLLSLLGEDIVDVEIHSDNDSISTIATVHDTGIKNQCWYSSILTVRFDVEALLQTNHTIRLRHLPLDMHPDIRYTVYYMDDATSSPYKIWNDSGREQTPSREMFRKMRQYEEPQVKHGPSDWSQGTSGNIEIEMSPISISLIQACSFTCSGPGKVIRVHVLNITFNQVLITWSDSQVDTKCLTSYEVEHSRKGLNFYRINSKPTIFNSFVFDAQLTFGAQDQCEGTIGYFRIRGVDLWGGFGQYSTPCKYPDVF